MQLFDFITWQVDPEIFNLLGRSVRWYGVLFALSFIIGQRVAVRFFKYKGYDEKLVDSFVIYSIIGTVAGARLGHVFFYGPYFTADGSGYLDNPLSILYVWEGGLASHGAMFGLLLSTFLFYKKKIQEEYLWLTDRLVLVVALAGCFIRFGNLMNSEIIGKPTNANHAFVFSKSATDNMSYYFQNHIDGLELEKKETTTIINGQQYQNLSLNLTLSKTQYSTTENCDNFIQEQLISYQNKYNKRNPDHTHIIFNKKDLVISTKDKGEYYISTVNALGVPRHPSQLYESISCLILFLSLFIFLDKKHKTIAPGIITGIFFTYVFTLRFIYEFFKEVQVSMESGWVINMGQILSIPAVLFGLFLIFYANKKHHA